MGPQSPYSPKPSEEEWQEARDSRKKWEQEQLVRAEEEKQRRIQDRLWREQYRRDLETS